MNIAWVALLTIAFIASMMLLYAVTLRVGPRRRDWNSPAAAFRAPGTGIALSLYAFGLLHVLLSLFAAIKVDLGGAGWQVVLVGVMAGGFYIACGSVAALAPRISWVRRISAHD
jgi:hypothetical protein